MSVGLLGLRQGGELRPPAEYADAVELYARRNGRHATMKFIPPLSAWVIEFTLKAGDPRMALAQAQITEEPKEVVYVWRWVEKSPLAKGMGCFVGYRLDELGVGGLIEWLEKSNTWGRGEYRSHTEAAQDQADKAVKAKEKIADEHRQNAKDRGLEYRRQVGEIPYLTVGITLTDDGPTTARPEEQ
jgi:hypothetical protein